MKIILSILLFFSVAFNAILVWEGRKATKLIRMNAEAWIQVMDAPVYIHKHLPTGDIYVQVPYNNQQFHFRKVCAPESKT